MLGMKKPLCEIELHTGANQTTASQELQRDEDMACCQSLSASNTERPWPDQTGLHTFRPDGEKSRPNFATLSHRYLVRKHKKAPASSDTGAGEMGLKRRKRQHQAPATTGEVTSEGRLSGYGAGGKRSNFTEPVAPPFSHQLLANLLPCQARAFGAIHGLPRIVERLCGDSAETSVCGSAMSDALVSFLPVSDSYFGFHVCSFRAVRTPLPSQSSTRVRCHFHMREISRLV